MKKKNGIMCPVNSINCDDLVLVEIHFISGAVEKLYFPEGSYEELTKTFLHETDDSSISIEVYPENIFGDCIHFDQMYFLYIDTSKIEYIK